MSFYRRLIRADEPVTGSEQLMGVRDECGSIERGANGLDVNGARESTLSEDFEAANVVFVGDEQQITIRCFERFVNCARLYVAHQLLNHVAVEIVDCDAIIALLGHISQEHLTKNRRSQAKKQTRGL